MTELTKERIEQFIKNPLEHGLTRSEQMEMARQLLAGMEQEPGEWVTYWPDTDEESNREHSRSNKATAYRIAVEIGGYVVPVYYGTPPTPQLPQPAVVPPEYATPARADNEWQSGYCIGWNACRAAMLQGASTPFVPVE